MERAAPHDSEGSLSAARSERSCFLDRMDRPNVKVARGGLWLGVSAALISPRRTRPAAHQSASSSKHCRSSSRSAPKVSERFRRCPRCPAADAATAGGKSRRAASIEKVPIGQIRWTELIRHSVTSKSDLAILLTGSPTSPHGFRTRRTSVLRW